MIEVREASAHELREAGEVTARAYEEFFGPDGVDTDRTYLARESATRRSERSAPRS